MINKLKAYGLNAIVLLNVLVVGVPATLAIVALEKISTGLLKLSRLLLTLGDSIHTVRVGYGNRYVKPLADRATKLLWMEKRK